MGLLELASTRSIYRGLSYYRSGAVLSASFDNKHTITAKVKGSNCEKYDVRIDLDNPRKCKCTCPHAQSRNYCKHMVAVYFYIHPFLADFKYRIIMDVLREDTERKQDEYESIKRQVMAMNIDELRNYVINSMIEENYHNQGYDDYEDQVDMELYDLFWEDKE